MTEKSNKLQGGDFTCGSFNKKILSLDIYAKPFEYLLPDHQIHYKTHTGAFFSILTILIVLSYAVFKTGNILARETYDI